ncbi:MAG: lipopolysaccharide biosynthesis protein [Methylococcales bacterium]|nr:lipopolysaccharide biosynthesis protein [Methylococcales bacterium]
MTLKSRALSATLWSGADIFMRQGLQFCVSIALARLLSPEEFGTIALLYLFTGIATAFVDSGFSTALIQRQVVTHTDESTVFWFNLAIGALVALGLWALAPFIATFFSLPILMPLTGLLALNIFLSAVGSIHGTLLTKHLNFRVQMKIGGFATLISGTLAITMAWYGYGIWALAAQTLAATSVTTLLLWCLSPWRPAWVFSTKSVRQLFGFGSYMLASSLLDIIYNRAYTVLIGHFFGVRELGFYNRADGTKQLPVGILTSIMARVALPIFSAAAQDKAQLRRGVQLALRGMMLINVPMMLGVAATAESLVLTLFGVKWLPSVSFLQVLSLGAVLWPLHVINLNVLMAQGHSHLFFRLEVIKKLLGTALLVAGTYYGVMGIAWSQVVFGVLAFFINAYYSQRFLGYGVFAQTRDFLGVLVISVLMAFAVYWVSIHAYLLPLHLLPAVQLLLLIAIGLIIFVGLALVFRLTALRDVIGLIKRRKAPLANS